MNQISKFRILFLTALMGVALSARAEGDKPLVLVDIPITAAIVQSFTGENANIEILLEPNLEAHHFTLTPQQVEQLSQADMIYGVGSIFLPEMVKASQNTRDKDQPHYFYSDNQPEIPSDANPHLWLSQSELFNMKTAFQDAWVSAGFALSENPKSWTMDVTGHINFGEDYPKFENSDVSLIASHAAFFYFEDDNQLKSFGAFHDAHDQPLPPRLFNEVIKKIQSGEVRCLLLEASEHDQNLETIAADNNMDVVEFDILGNDIPPQDTYFETYFSQLNLAYEMCQYK